jgi:hypothetical protein
MHASAFEIPEADRGKFIFGFVRHPVLAEYSRWRYDRYSWKNANEQWTFSNYCYWKYGQDDMLYAERFGLTFKQIFHGWTFNQHPQAGYFTDETGKCIADKIYRFEELESSLQDISSRIGLDCSLGKYRSMAYHWGTTGDARRKENYWDDIKDEDIELIRRGKGFDFDWILTEGEVSTDYAHPSFKKYGSSHCFKNGQLTNP